MELDRALPSDALRSLNRTEWGAPGVREAEDATAVVMSVGSHEPDACELPDARKLDAALLGRATVVVEDVATALRGAGDVVLAIAEGALTAADLVPMRDVVTGTVTSAGRPAVGL